MKEMQKQIIDLKKEKNAVIMAHYYVDDDVQEIADYVGDSYYLSEMATKVEAETIVLCGVSFMGESAKILNPGKGCFYRTLLRIVRWPIWHLSRMYVKYGKNTGMMWQLSAT